MEKWNLRHCFLTWYSRHPCFFPFSARYVDNNQSTARCIDDNQSSKIQRAGQNYEYIRNKIQIQIQIQIQIWLCPVAGSKSCNGPSCQSVSQHSSSSALLLQGREILLQGPGWRWNPKQEFPKYDFDTNAYPNIFDDSFGSEVIQRKLWVGDGSSRLQTMKKRERKKTAWV